MSVRQLMVKKKTAVVLGLGLVLGTGLLARSAHAATELSKKSLSDGAANDLYGFSVLLDQGDLFVGAPRRANNGAVFAYFGDASGTVEPVVFEPPEGVRNNYFGTRILRQGSELFISSQRAKAGDVFSAGALHVYSPDESGTWNLAQTIVADSPSVNDFFSDGVAVSGDLMVVGAPRRDAEDGTRDAGAAYVFVRGEDGSWAQDGFLTPPVNDRSARFGQVVATDGERVMVSMVGYDQVVTQEEASFVIGDVGAVFVYEKDEQGAWTKVQDILGPAPSARAKFGSSMHVNEGRLYVGSPSDRVEGVQSGSIYSFELLEGQWSFAHRTVPVQPRDSLLFGLDFSISPGGRFMAVGSPGAGSVGLNAGEIEVFRKANDGSWANESLVTLVPSDIEEQDFVGSAVSVSDTGTLIAGVRNDDDGGAQSGSVYRFGDFPSAPVAPLGLLALGAGGLALLRRRGL